MAASMFRKRDRPWLSGIGVARTAQPVVRAVENDCSAWKPFLVDERRDRVERVDKVADAQPAGLRYKLMCVLHRQEKTGPLTQRTNPSAAIRTASSSGRAQPITAISRSVSIRGHEDVVGLADIEDELGFQSAFDRRPGELAIALREMAIADIDHRVVDIGAQVEGGPAARSGMSRLPPKAPARRSNELHHGAAHSERAVEGSQRRADFTSSPRCRRPAFWLYRHARSRPSRSAPDRRFGLFRVPESAPKLGETVATPQSRAGSSEIRWIARRSPAAYAIDGDRPGQRVDAGKRRDLAWFSVDRRELARKAVFGEHAEFSPSRLRILGSPAP